jgi:hypothetical protein
MTNLFETTFESGSDGSVIVPASEGFESATGTNTYDSAVRAHGTYSAKIIPAGNVGYEQWYAGSYLTGDVWGRVYLHVDQALSVATHTVAFFDGALQKASIVLTSDGRVVLRNSSLNTDRVTSTVVWSPNQWIRLEWRTNYTTDAFECWVYVTDPDGTTEDVHIAVPAGVGIPKWHRVRFGVNYASASESYVTHWDNPAISQTGKIGPSAPDPVPPATLNHMWVGGVTNNAATVATRLTAATTATLLYAVDPGTGDPLTGSPSSTPTATPDANGSLSFALSGLAENTAYVYGIKANGTLNAARGHFRTMPRGSSSFNVAFSSGQADASDHTIFDTIRTTSPTPKLFFHLGDMFQTAVGTNDPAIARARYNTQLGAGTGRFRNLVQNVPTDYVWNVTDWGGVGGDLSNVAAPALISAYQQYTAQYPLTDPNSALYHTVTIGRVMFIVLDVRSRRSTGTILGATQKQWLKDQLIASSYPVKVIVCPLPWRTSSEWSAATAELAEINTYITTNTITNVMMIGGTEHAIAADSGTDSSIARKNVIAGALDGTGANATGTWDQGNHGNTGGAGQYGLLAVADTGGSTITITYSGRNQTDTVLVGPYAITFTLAAGHVPQVKYWDGTSWVLFTPRVYLSGTWKKPPVKVWSGSTWLTI